MVQKISSVLKANQPFKEMLIQHQKTTDEEKSDINEIVNGVENSEDQKSAIINIRTLY